MLKLHSQIVKMELYKVWMSKYKDQDDAILFINLNNEEVTGIYKIFYLLKPLLGNDFIFSINRTTVSKSNKSVQQYRYRNIYPYIERVRDISFYKAKIDNFQDKIHLIISITFTESTKKEYILFLDDLNQLNGCIFGLQLFDMNVNETVISIGKGKDNINIPNIDLENRIVK